MAQSNHPKLNNLNNLFNTGKTFKLTDSEYESLTGVRMPKDKNYLLKHSALARKVEKEGYLMKLVEKEITFEKK